MDLIYPLAKQGYATAAISWTADNIKAALVSSSYTYSAAHQYLSSLTGILATSGNLTTKTITNGVHDADDISLTGVNGAGAALIFYKDTGSSATSPLIAFMDGKFQFRIAATATSATPAVDPLDMPVASGAVATRISGTGAANLTFTGASAAGDRSIPVTSASVVVGDVYEVSYSGSGLPTANGSNVTVNFTFNNGTNKIFAL